MSVDYDSLAKKYQFSREAVDSLMHAITRGRGAQAQFNHPEFGGMGQWMPGMVMISDMMNNGLKARIAGLAEELRAEAGAGLNYMAPMASLREDHWWGVDLGIPAMRGSQNNSHYAYFPEEQRLMIKRNNRVIAYDTANYHLTGVQQAQSNTSATLVFTTQTGTVREDDLHKITP